MHPPSSYYTPLTAPLEGDSLAALADRVFAQVFRRDFRASGVALIGLGTAVDSAELRRFMVALKEVLDARFQALAGRRLIYLSMGRFDQQVTTKFHRDGAPEESFLMLGYEPTRVRSALAVADYSRAAHDLGIEPRQFLTEHNPMYVAGEQQLAPYVTELQAFDPAAAQVLLLNNSVLPYRADGSNQLGVLHRAVMLNPTTGERRVVNSTMLGTAADVRECAISPAHVQTFLETEEGAGR